MLPGPLPGPGPGPASLPPLVFRGRSLSGLQPTPDVEDVEASLGTGRREASSSRSATSSSAEPSLADVESASLADTEAQSSSVDPLEEADAAACAEQVKAERWQCDLCFELHPRFEKPWRLGDDRCSHNLCRRCLLGSIRWGGRCPYDNTPIPPIVVCGAMGTGEYVYHEKLNEVQRTGGIPCSGVDCPGVCSTCQGLRPRSVSCPECGVMHCGRRVCGVPWTQGHRCWDLLEQERQELEARAPRSHDFQASTNRRLARTPRFRPCPQCGAMVEHIGGCNMVYHDSCRTRWCFICRKVGTCQDFDCKAPSSGPPTPVPTPRTPRSASWAQVSLASGAASASSSGVGPVPMKVASHLMVIFVVVSLAMLLVIDTFMGFRLGMPRTSLPFLGLSSAPGSSQGGNSSPSVVVDICPGQSSSCAGQAQAVQTALLSSPSPPPEFVEV